MSQRFRSFYRGILGLWRWKGSKVVVHQTLEMILSSRSLTRAPLELFDAGLLDICNNPAWIVCGTLLTVIDRGKVKGHPKFLTVFLFIMFYCSQERSSFEKSKLKWIYFSLQKVILFLFLIFIVHVSSVPGLPGCILLV